MEYTREQLEQFKALQHNQCKEKVSIYFQGLGANVEKTIPEIIKEVNYNMNFVGRAVSELINEGVLEDGERKLSFEQDTWHTVKLKSNL